jgi:hypothetical protein
MGYANAGVDPTRRGFLGLRASWIKPLAYGVSAAAAVQVLVSNNARRAMAVLQSSHLVVSISRLDASAVLELPHVATVEC